MPKAAESPTAPPRAPAPHPDSATTAATPRGLRLAGYAALALLAYVPVLLNSVGRVLSDTKSYLYLDPTRQLESSVSLWNPSAGLGTVTHQNIGYLLPMGPYYWLTEQLGIPTWVAQRLWLGTLLFAAALGVRYLLRTLHMQGPGIAVAAVVYMFSPYVVDFAARTSTMLLPWAGLPWLLAFTVRALRDKGWKYPALFAIVAQVVGSINATALILVLIAPGLWILYATFVTREVDWHVALRAVGRIGLLLLLSSLWWAAGIWAQGAYGINILGVTETLETVAHASLPGEVLRGLGFWFFYGGDRLGPWNEASVAYTQDLPLIAVSFALPLLTFSAAAMIRWRHRAFFVLLMLVGFIIAVGAYPYDDPSFFGGFFKDFAAASSLGFALRSSVRATPLVALGGAVLLGVAVSAALAARLRHRTPLLAVGVAAVVIVLAAANLPSLWQGELFGTNLDYEVPSYWRAAIDEIDARDNGTRALEIPGADFAAYRWGYTFEPITPALTDRPFAARELVPWGSPASADLLTAFDERMQEGVLDPAAIVPLARLMGVGDLVVRSDLETERYDLVRAVPLWRLLTQPSLPEGLGEPLRFGAPTTVPSPLDELTLGLPADAEVPPPVSIFPVDDPLPVVRAASADTPLIVSGSGEGLVDLAPLGVLDHGRVVLYSASYAGDTAELRREIRRDESLLVVTDTNRKRGRRWRTVRDTHGPTERVKESTLTDDVDDSRLDVFPDAGTDAQTVVLAPDARVSTSRIGNRTTYWPETRGARALDGDVNTAWEVGDHNPVIGERIRVDLPEPIHTDHVNLVQRLVGAGVRTITQVTLTFDGTDTVTVPLDDASRTPDGQTVTFDPRSFERLEIRIDDTNVGGAFDEPASNDVGFAEIRMRDDAPGATDARATEIVRMPVDLVDAAGKQAASRPLVYSMRRSRTIVVPPRSSQDEIDLVRQFRVPDTRAFALGGTVRLATAVADDQIDAVLGIPGAGSGGVTVTSSSHLPGDIGARGSSALDGDPSTTWQPAFGEQNGQWLEVRAGQPVTLDHLDLQVVNDGRHSVPTQVRVDAGGQSRVVDLPAIADVDTPGSVATAPVTFAPLVGDVVRVTVNQTRPVVTNDQADPAPVAAPVAIAELGAAGLARAPVPVLMPATCRSDLLALDGAPVPTRLSGSTADAAASRPVNLEPCAALPELIEGDHRLTSAPGLTTGIDVDTVVLGSQADGAPMALGPGGNLTGATAPSDAAARAPTVRVTDTGRSHSDVAVHDAEPGKPFWLILGESHNAGWQAQGPTGVPTESSLVDGYANGWLVHPHDEAFSVTLTWTPQRIVWIALGVSALTLIACIAMAVVWRRRGRRDTTSAVTADGGAAFSSPLTMTGRSVRVGRAVAGALGSAVVAAVVARWWVGLLVGVLVFVVARLPRLRPLLAVGAPACVLLVGLYVIVQQHRFGYAYGYPWVDHFGSVTEIAWLAILLLAADAVVELLRGAPPDPGYGVPTTSTSNP